MIGPYVLGWASPDTIEPFVNLGPGFLFLLAGDELDYTALRARPGRLAIVGWTISVLLAVGVVGALEATGFVHAFVPVALALTTTALGIPLPILRENHMIGGTVGSQVVAAGAVGEFFPIVAIAILLGANGEFVGLISLLIVAVVALLLSLVPWLIRGGRTEAVILAGENATTQTTLRGTILLLLLRLVVNERDHALLVHAVDSGRVAAVRGI